MGLNRKSQRDIPPEKPLKGQVTSKQSNGAARDTDYSANDTPRAFQRLFQTYRPPRSGQDDGIRPPKKRKTAHKGPTRGTPIRSETDDNTTADLQIRPGEPLSHFSARVDAALPFAALSKTPNLQDPLLRDVSKARVTKLEKRMKKMQQAWREEDQRRKDKVLGDGEEREGAVDESDVEDMGVEQGGDGNPKTKKSKARGRNEDDLWEEFERSKRTQANGKAKNASGLVGIHDVVQAPPHFKKRRSTADSGVKAKHGGLKHKVELSDARRSVIDGYRSMMKERREDNGR